MNVKLNSWVYPQGLGSQGEHLSLQMAPSVLHLISTAQYSDRDVEDGQDCKEPEGKEAMSKDQILGSGQSRVR